MIVEVKKVIETEIDHYDMIQYSPFSILRQVAMNLVNLISHEISKGKFYRYQHIHKPVEVMGIKFICLEEWK